MKTGNIGIRNLVDISIADIDVYGNDENEFWMRKIKSLLEQKCIAEVYYINNFYLDGPKYISKEGIKLTLKNGVFYKDLYSFGNGMSKINDLNIDFNHEGSILYYKNSKSEWSSVSLFHKDRNHLEKIYNTLKSNSVQSLCKIDKNKLDFATLSTKIQKQLETPELRNLQTCINIQELNAQRKVINDNTLKSTYKQNKPCQVNIQLLVDHNGKVSISKMELTDAFFKDSDYWKQEIKKRGLDSISEKELIEQMKKDFSESKTLFQNFINNFNKGKQITADILGIAITTGVNKIQVGTKITKNVWDEGILPKGLWYSKEKDRNFWNKNFTLHPLAGGGTDGVIDEAIGMPMACKEMYGMVTDEQKREAFGKIFTADGFSAMVDGMKKEAVDIANDTEKLQHFGSQTTVSVVTTFSGIGGITKIGKLNKLSDLADMVADVNKVAKKADNIVEEISAITKKIDELKKVVRHAQTQKALDDILLEFGTEAVENNLDELLEAVTKTIKKDEWIAVLKKFKLGRKLEQNVSDRMAKELIQGGGEYVDDLAQKFGVTIGELAGMKQISQLQIHLPQGGYMVLDDVFVKEIRNLNNEITGYKLFCNETKLSKAADLTGKQKDLKKALTNGTTNFNTRSKLSEINKILPQATEVTIEKWVKTLGNGVADAKDLKIETLF